MSQLLLLSFQKYQFLKNIHLDHLSNIKKKPSFTKVFQTTLVEYNNLFDFRLQHEKFKFELNYQIK